MNKRVYVILVLIIALVAGCGVLAHNYKETHVLAEKPIIEEPEVAEPADEPEVNEEPVIEDPEVVEPDDEEAIQEVLETPGGVGDDGRGADEEDHQASSNLPYTEPNDITPERFQTLGVIYWGGYRWTWYSENVLPGGGLKIPGRWSDGTFVRDEDGCICVASSDLPWGTYIDTPWGPGRIYDCGCASGTLDVYVSW